MLTWYSCVVAAMSGARKARPSLFQSHMSTLLLVMLSLLMSPVTFFLTVTCYLYATFSSTFADSAYQHRRVKTVLVTGGRANKALTLCRAFKRVGYRVILAEEGTWGTLTCARFSRAVDYFHHLPDPHTGSHEYIQELKRIVTLWAVDTWVPCSSVHATTVDSEAAFQIVSEVNSIAGVPACEPFIPFPKVASTLHWKDRFEELCIELGYPVPESRRVTSVAEAVEFLHASETIERGHKYLLKSLTLDDHGRDDFTLFPLPTRKETTHHLSTVPTSLSESDPFFLQRFLYGPEYCTHVAVRNGKLVAFVACRSNQLLMRYTDVRNLSPQEREVGVRLEQWTQEFLDHYKAKLEREGRTEWEYTLTGHFSFDFIVEDDIIYVLECNVVRSLLSGDYGSAWLNTLFSVRIPP